MDKKLLIAFGVIGAIVTYFVVRQTASANVKELFVTFEEESVKSVLSIIAGFEGFRDSPYLDTAGKWTIGYGHLIVPGDGFWHPDFNPGGIKYLSREDALILKQKDAGVAENDVARCVSAPLTENQRAALISLAFNIGGPQFCGSTAVRLINQRDYQGGADAMLAWNKVVDPTTGALVYDRGLAIRRTRERELFLT